MNSHCLLLHVLNLSGDLYSLFQYLHSAWHLQSNFIILRNLFRQPYISRHFFSTRSPVVGQRVLLVLVFFRIRCTTPCSNFVRIMESNDLNTPGWGWFLLEFNNCLRSLWFISEPTLYLEYKLKISAVFVNSNYCNCGRYFKLLKQKASPSSEQDSALTRKESQNTNKNMSLGADHFAENKIQNAFHSSPL